MSRYDEDDDYWREQDYLRDQIEREDNRQDYIDQDQRNWENHLDDRRNEEQLEAKRHEQFMEAIKRGDVSSAIHASAGPEAAGDYLQSILPQDTVIDDQADEFVAKARQAYEAGDYKNAQAELELALIFKPGHPALQFHKGMCLFRLEHFDEAISM